MDRISSSPPPSVQANELDDVRSNAPDRGQGALLNPLFASTSQMQPSLAGLNAIARRPATRSSSSESHGPSTSLRSAASTPATRSASRHEDESSATLQRLWQRSAPPAQPRAETAAERVARQQGVHAAIASYFMKHAPDGEDSNRAALALLVEDRVAELVEMGETRETIEATFAKARLHDIGSEGARGFFGSLPFGVASRLLDTKPVIGDTLLAGLNIVPGLKNAPSAFKTGMAGGLMSGVADHVGSEALRPAMKDTQWLAAPADKLDASMADAKARADAGMLRSVAENAASTQTFTVRNLVRGVVGPTLVAAGQASAAARTDSWMAAIGSPLSGAGFYLINRHLAEKGHRTGPEYLLGRTDWREQYQALKAATWKGAVANGAGRAAQAVVNTADAILSAPHTLLSASSIAMNAGALGVGLGVVTLAVSKAGELASKNGASSAGVVAAEHAARTAISAGVFAAWTTAGIVTDPAVSAVRGVSKSAGDWVQKSVSAVARTSAEKIGEGAVAGVDYAAPKLEQARDATLRTGRETLESVSGSIGNMKATASEAIHSGVNNATNTVGEVVAQVRRRVRSAPAQHPPGTDPRDIALGDWPAASVLAADRSPDRTAT